VRLSADQAIVEEWTMQQPAAAGRVAGELSATGSMRLNAASELTVNAKRFVLPITKDQRLVVSGSGKLSLSDAGVELSARLTADEARLILRSNQTLDLGDDVRIIPKKSAAKPAVAPTANAKRLPFTSTIDLDLGPQFEFSGEGVKGTLTGKLTMQAIGANSLRANGTVNIQKGTVARYGQQLQIERGVLRFAGPLDNPALDIEAKRQGLPVDVSLLVAGSAQNPRVRLQSTQALTDAEKLSWLALGAPLSDSLGAEQSGTFAAALAALIADASGAESGITQALGLSQLGLSKNDKGTNIVSIGKRLSDRLLITYEQGLRGVWNVLKIQLQLTKQLELRVEAGTENAADLLWVIPLQ
jgi:translocation and assembly module TamB